MNFKQSYEFAMTAPIWHSILFKGIHGTGKSALAKLVSDTIGGIFIDLRLSQKEVGDLTGLPFFVKGRTIYASPEWFPMKEEDARQLSNMLGVEEIAHKKIQKGLILYDEVDRATPQVQQAAFELCLDRRLNMKGLPELIKQMACINGDSDIYKVRDMGPAFVDRWVWVDVEFSSKEYLDYANGRQDLSFVKTIPEDILRKSYELKGPVFHRAVLGFNTIRPDLLDPTKEQIENIMTERPGSPKLHSRRSWERLSDFLKVHEMLRREGVVDRDIFGSNEDDRTFLRMAVSAYVGAMAASAFSNYVENDFNLLSADKILNHFDSSVMDKLQDMKKNDRIMEITNLRELISDYIRKNKIASFNENQSNNFTKYIKVLDYEHRAIVWKDLVTNCKEVVTQWFRSNSQNSELIREALVTKD